MDISVLMHYFNTSIGNTIQNNNIDNLSSSIGAMKIKKRSEHV